MYKHHRTNHSRLLNREFLQKISLCFLIGFLCGAVFYYCFQNSFREILQATLENNTKTWTKETALFTEWFRSLWNHGKYFALIWFLAISPAGPVSQKIFVVYTGIRNGFLFGLFFICKKCIWHHCLLCQSDSTSLFTGAVISFLVLCDNRKQAAKARKNHNCSYDFYFFNCLSD